jgi:hypothetical protein
MVVVKCIPPQQQKVVGECKESNKKMKGEKMSNINEKFVYRVTIDDEDEDMGAQKVVLFADSEDTSLILIKKYLLETFGNQDGFTLVEYQLTREKIDLERVNEELQDFGLMGCSIEKINSNVAPSFTSKILEEDPNFKIREILGLPFINEYEQLSEEDFKEFLEEDDDEDED